MYENSFFGILVCNYLAWISIFHSQTKPTIYDYIFTAIILII